MDCSAGLEATEKLKTSCSCQESNLGSSVVRLRAYNLQYKGNWKTGYKAELWQDSKNIF
jgi:hypothetical protein